MKHDPLRVFLSQSADGIGVTVPTSGKGSRTLAVTAQRLQLAGLIKRKLDGRWHITPDGLAVLRAPPAQGPQ